MSLNEKGKPFDFPFLFISPTLNTSFLYRATVPTRQHRRRHRQTLPLLSASHPLPLVLEC